MIKQFYRSVCFASVMLFLIGSSALHAQGVITGKISDKAGQALPGVNVIKKGTTSGTSTDANGNYSIEATSSDILVVSFIGYQSQEIVVGSRAKVDVQLEEDVAELQEVVVVGYGTQKKSDLTGSVASLSGDKMRGSMAANVNQALQGRIAGVNVSQNSGQPGSAVSIRIRGTASLNGGNEPLYVIDGVQVGGGAGQIAGFDFAGGANGQGSIVNPLANINPNDIESIEVLKDASASAIYGSRAANGVILITTKRGKSGESKIDYNGYYGLQQVPKTLDMMDLPQYAAYQFSVAKEIPSINPDARFADPSILGPGTDWQDAIFEVAPIQNHQLSTSGGTEKTQYFLSGGYFQQDGILRNSGFERFSSRINLDTKATNWLKVGTSLNFAITDEVIGRSDGGDGIIAQALQMPPSTPVYDFDGNFAGPDAGSAQITSNPVAVSFLINNKVKKQTLTANFYAEATLTKGLTFRTEYAINDSHSLNKVFKPTYEWGAIKNDANQLRHRQENNFFWIWKNYLTYNFDVDRHHFTAMLGQESQRSTYEGSDFTKSNLTSNDIITPNQGEPTSINGWQGENTLSSYYGRLIYNFADRYYVTAMIRRDGSSRFGPNSKWGNFPAVSFAWRIANEGFMPKSDFLSDLKLRIGYGKVGNQDIPNYAYGASLSSIQNTALGTTYIPNRIPNPDLGWEATATYNAGIDASFLSGRIDLTVDAYKKYSDNLLLELNPPGYILGSMINPPYSNYGKIENKGLEITVSSRNVQGEKFSWRTDLNYSVNRNKITAIDRPQIRNLYWYAGFQTVTRTTINNPIGQFYGYQTEGIFVDRADIEGHAVQVGTGETSLIHQRDGVWLGDLKFKDQNGDNRIDEKDQVAIGNPNPKFSFGFNNSFSYGNLTLDINIIGVYGFDVFNYQRSRNQGMNSLNDNQLSTVANRAQFEMIDPAGSAESIDNYVLLNPNATIPRFSQLNVNANGRMSDMWIEDGSYARIQNISLSYMLPKPLISKIKMSRARVYVNVQNAYTFTNYSGYDAEIGAFNQSALMQNIDMGRIPAPRIYTAGLEIGF
ncbi:MAG TPA: TonB-dependent receptor [Chryseolinea sp.]|nr:TonB-dependent receptor [Chryseolinea sp.]